MRTGRMKSLTSTTLMSCKRIRSLTRRGLTRQTRRVKRHCAVQLKDSFRVRVRKIDFAARPRISQQCLTSRSRAAKMISRRRWLFETGGALAAHHAPWVCGMEI
jgi:hypothetical protein